MINKKLLEKYLHNSLIKIKSRKKNYPNHWYPTGIIYKKAKDDGRIKFIQTLAKKFDLEI